MGDQQQVAPVPRDHPVVAAGDPAVERRAAPPLALVVVGHEHVRADPGHSAQGREQGQRYGSISSGFTKYSAPLVGSAPGVSPASRRAWPSSLRSNGVSTRSRRSAAGAARRARPASGRGAPPWAGTGVLADRRAGGRRQARVAHPSWTTRTAACCRARPRRTLPGRRSRPRNHARGRPGCRSGRHPPRWRHRPRRPGRARAGTREGPRDGQDAAPRAMLPTSSGCATVACRRRASVTVRLPCLPVYLLAVELTRRIAQHPAPVRRARC